MLNFASFAKIYLGSYFGKGIELSYKSEICFNFSPSILYCNAIPCLQSLSHANIRIGRDKFWDRCEL